MIFLPYLMVLKLLFFEYLWQAPLQKIHQYGKNLEEKYKKKNLRQYNTTPEKEECLVFHECPL